MRYVLVIVLVFMMGATHSQAIREGGTGIPETRQVGVKPLATRGCDWTNLDPLLDKKCFEQLVEGFIETYKGQLRPDVSPKTIQEVMASVAARMDHGCDCKCAEPPAKTR